MAGIWKVAGDSFFLYFSRPNPFIAFTIAPPRCTYPIKLKDGLIGHTTGLNRTFRAMISSGPSSNDFQRIIMEIA
jgi:hypothetical protein